MPPPPRPWEDASPAGPVVSPVLESSGDGGVNNGGAALVVPEVSALGTSSNNPPPLPAAVTPSAHRLASANRMGGYGGMGMGGYGGMGMGGYGGMGMGGYGGMGMMGMGGMGMMGMGMYGSEAEQRGQMLLMVITRIVEMFHGLTNVMQMTVGSAMQFVTSFTGLSQQYQQLTPQTSETQADGAFPLEHPSGAVVGRIERPSTLTGVLARVLRKALLFCLALYLTNRIHRYFTRSQRMEAELESAFQSASQQAFAAAFPAASPTPSSQAATVNPALMRGAHSPFAYSAGGLGYGMNYY